MKEPLIIEFPELEDLDTKVLYICVQSLKQLSSYRADKVVRYLFDRFTTETIEVEATK